MNKRKTNKPTGGQPKIVRLDPIVFCCSLGPRFRAKGSRVQCVGRKNHSGHCRSSEFSSWDRRNPLVWLSEEHRGAKLKPAELVAPEADKAAE